MKKIKNRNMFGFHAFNRSGAGVHRDKKRHDKTYRGRQPIDDDDVLPEEIDMDIPEMERIALQIMIANGQSEDEARSNISMLTASELADFILDNHWQQN